MPIAERAAAILACSGLVLTDDERRLFDRLRPAGFILFDRNIDDPDQVRALVASLRDCVEDAAAPVLIDQEGGRVQRLRPPHWRRYPAAARYGEAAGRDPDRAIEAATLGARLIAADLSPLGIDVDCAPVLDVPVAGSHDVVGDRAFSHDPTLVATLGEAACEGFLAGGVAPVIKHLPGHGRARADSHVELPVVEASLAELDRQDFSPFRALRHAPWAMTAHVVYAALDERPATLSPTVIAEVIRGRIGFEGVLVTDDLGMKALSAPLAERARGALAAGCDLALYCWPQIRLIEELAPGLSPLSDEAAERLAHAAAARHAAAVAAPPLAAGAWERLGELVELPAA